MTPERRPAPLFRLLLRLFPRGFREEHGAGMQELFETRLARARGPGRRLGVWTRTLGDVAGAAWAVRWGTDDITGRRRGGASTMDTLLQDFRQTLRHLARAPVFTVGAVLLLAVGIGANATVFTVVDGLLFRPPPWGDAERVVHVYQDSDDGEPNSTSFPAYRDMTEIDVFASVAAVTPNSATLERTDGPVTVEIEYATASLMEVLGLSPARGRWFGPEHDVVGNAYAAVVSWSTWVSRFGADPDLVGSTVRLNGQPVTVVGVGPRTLPSSFPPFLTDFWLSISSTPLGGDYMVANLDRRADHWYDVRARLAEGVTPEQASAAMDALAARLAADFPEFNQGRDITVFRAADVRTHPSADAELFAAGTLLSAVVAVVLLLACANLANLLLVRGLGRSGEMAVRRAMGAGSGRVARLFFLEALTLAVVGGGLGVLFTAWAVKVIPTLPLPDAFPGLLDLHLDARVLTYSLALVAVTGMLFGLAPAVRAARTDVAGSLRDDRRTSSLGRGTARLRGALVAVQVAASLLLVVGTGLLVRSLTAVQAADPGVDVARIAWVRTDLGAVVQSQEELRPLLDEVRERVAALPGVTAVAATHRLPAQSGSSTTTVVEDYTPQAGTEAVELDYLAVDDGYFAAMGLDVLAGRTFNDDDVPDGPTSVVVNETAARTFWGDTDVVGRRMRGQGSDRWRTVVGVVSDAPVSTLAEDTRPAFYFFEAQIGGLGTPYLVVRTDGDPAALLPQLRGALTDVRSALTVEAQGTLADHFGATLAAPRLAATFLGAFSLLAAVLAGLGIYAVVSFSVAGRAAELGIRMALGARRERVVGMVVRDVAGTVVLGLVAGLVLAVLVGPRVADLLYGVGGLDPVAFAGSVAFITVVAGLAAWLPARRAADTDPVEALRSA